MIQGNGNDLLRLKMLMSIDLLEEFGSQLRYPYSEHREDGIFVKKKTGQETRPVPYMKACPRFRYYGCGECLSQ